MCVLTSPWLLSSLPVGELLVVYTLLVFIICLFVCLLSPRRDEGGRSGLDYVVQVVLYLLEPARPEFSAAFVGKLIIAFVKKVGVVSQGRGRERTPPRPPRLVVHWETILSCF